MENTEPRTKVSNLLLVFFFLVTITSISVGIFRYFWIESYLSQTREATFGLAQQLGSFAASTGVVEDQIWKEFVRREKRVAYIVVEYQPLTYQAGFFHRKRIKNVSYSLNQYLKKYDREKMMQMILTDGAGFPGEYMHVVSAKMISSSAPADSDYIGTLKVGYVFPGRIWSFLPLGRGFQFFVLLIYGFNGFLLFSIVLQSSWYRRMRYGKNADLEVLGKGLAEDSDFTWIEDETGRTEPIYIDEQGRSWKILLPDGNTANWSLKGIWYVSSGELVGRPWGSSAVRQDLVQKPSYLFQVRAYKMAGTDGFVILFPVGSIQLAWVIGGWRNTKTEVSGYPSTTNAFKVDRSEWYYLEIRVTEAEVVGSINGQVNWKLPRAEILKSSPEVGFQNGLGLAVWNSLARFGDIRYYYE